MSVADHQIVDRRDPGRIAFVLQGGGSMTAPQIGMLHALHEAGVVPDLVIGSSAGALNAVAFAEDPSSDGLDRLEDWWLGLRRKHVAPVSAATLLGALTHRGESILPGAPLAQMVGRYLQSKTFEDLAIPTHVVATDRRSGAAVVLSHGPLLDALLASSAFPGLYPPVRMGGLDLIDGGVAADVPVRQAEDLGAELSIVLPAATTDEVGMPHGPVAHVYQALHQILDAASRRDIDGARGTVLVLPIARSRIVNPVDFRDTARLIDEGYHLGSDWLSQHRDEIRPRVTAPSQLAPAV
jgi:NTE family protein